METNQIKIFLVEDEPILVDQLRIQIEELGYWFVGFADNADRAKQMILNVKPDIVLMDVNIKGEKTGIDLAIELKEQNHTTIFITSLDDEYHFEKSKAALPFDYLIKPVTARKLKRSIELSQLTRTENKMGSEEIFLKEKSAIHRVTKSDILFIEVQDKVCLIHVNTSTLPLNIRMGLSELFEKLDSANFIKVHRSFAVNRSHIDSYDISTNKLITGSHRIPVSRTYRATILDTLKKNGN